MLESKKYAWSNTILLFADKDEKLSLNTESMDHHDHAENVLMLQKKDEERYQKLLDDVNK